MTSMKKQAKAHERTMTLLEVLRARQILQLAEQRQKMIDYLAMKLDACDWHGVADAAMDLREIEAKLSVLQSEMPK